MKVTLITVGKIKEKFFQDAIAEYSKRLSRYCKLEIVQVADEKTPDGASEAVETQIKEKEGERILSNIKDGSFVVALAINGNMLDSEELAAKIEKWGVSGISQIVFIIGGSLGLSNQVLARADYKLSFSKMTFPHQLMRVILLEQIYRSYRINRNLIFHQFGGRFSSDADKHTVASKRAFLSSFHIPSPDTGQLFVMEQCDDLTVPEEFYIFRFHQRLMVDLCCF